MRPTYLSSLFIFSVMVSAIRKIILQRQCYVLMTCFVQTRFGGRDGLFLKFGRSARAAQNEEPKSEVCVAREVAEHAYLVAFNAGRAFARKTRERSSMTENCHAPAQSVSADLVRLQELLELQDDQASLLLDRPCESNPCNCVPWALPTQC